MLMALRVQKHSRFTTKDDDGHPNGFLIPIFNIHDDFVSPENKPQQVYLTVCEAGKVKGPHLHLKRCGFFTCVRGNIRVVARTPSGYEEYFSGEDYEFATVEVPAGIPSAIQNIGGEPAYVINTPSPAWHVDDQDEHKVVFDKSALAWPK
jgi:dTDP-4-dehydrorhamnose 3,5-epimerase-like enzyme